MKKIIGISCIVSVLAACTNNNVETTNKLEIVAKIDSLEAPSNVVPMKVTGAFLGNLPCKDCKMLHRLINLQEGYYSIQEHHEGTIDKSKLLVQYTGKCSQDSGIVNLYDTANKAFQLYKIISKDTIQLTAVKGKVVANPIYFINKEGKKIVH